MPKIKINYINVCVSAIVVILIGMLWYSPILFGDAWLEAHGYSTEQMRDVGIRNLLVSLVCFAVMAAVLSIFVSYAGVTTYRQGAFMGFLGWIGFLATLGMTAHLVLDHPWSIYFIDTGHQFVYSIAMGAIIGGWRR